MPNLVLLIGIPGSGKSFLAAQLQQRFQAQGCFVISTDQIRARLFGDEAVQGPWRLVWQVVGQELQRAARLAGLTVYDATNARRCSRREVIRLARQAGFQQVFGLWLDPFLGLCLERNRQRSRQVPEAVICRMHQQLRTSPPKLSEGLDLLLHCDDSICGDSSLRASSSSSTNGSEDWLARIETRLHRRLDSQPFSGSGSHKLDSSGSSTEIAPADDPEPNPQFC